MMDTRSGGRDACYGVTNVGRRLSDTGDRRGAVERLAHAVNHGAAVALSSAEARVLFELVLDGRTDAMTIESLVAKACDWRGMTPPRGDALQAAS